MSEPGSPSPSSSPPAPPQLPVREGGTIPQVVAAPLDVDTQIWQIKPPQNQLVVIVKGTQGVSPPMFPVMADGVSLAQNPTLTDLETVTAAENGIRALGTTNALYVDVDQNGVFDPPGVSVVP